MNNNIMKKIYISNGNIKMGKIPSLSLTPIKSCADNILYGNDCYSLKAYRMYPKVRNAWDSNLKLWMNYPNDFKSLTVEYFTKFKKKFFRWHVAGDIPDLNYLDMMINIGNSFPKINFLAFTKKYDLVNLKEDIIPSNLSIIFSSWPKFNMNNPFKFPIAFMQDGTEDRVTNAIECHGNCEYCEKCWIAKEIGKNVVFNKH